MKGYLFTPAKSRPSSHIIIGTYGAERRSQETIEEITEDAEEATAATADPAVAWARGPSSRQVGQD